MKKLFICFFVICMAGHAAGRSKQRYDFTGILIIDRMSDMISYLQSCSFKLVTTNDVADCIRGEARK